MKQKWIVIAALLVVSAGSAWAQSASDSFSVSARNIGIFQFDIVGTTFDFGDVDADGNTSTTGVTGARNGGDTGAIYTQAAATTFTCSSAPSRTVRVFNGSTTSTINWGAADRLSLQVPTSGLPGTPTSCGYVAFGTNGDGGAGNCASGNLAHSITVGNGSNAATGNIDLQLEVLDSDATSASANSWTVVLTAAGT